CRPYFFFFAGSGEFGAVYKGSWMGTPVALKSLKDDSAVREFEQEAEVLRSVRVLLTPLSSSHIHNRSSLNHPNVVRFLGLYASRAPASKTYIVTEFLAFGALPSLLRNNRADITLQHLLSMAVDTAKGMTYLESMSVIHRYA